MDIFEKLDGLKLITQPKALAVVALSSFAFVVLSPEAVERLGLTSILDKVRPWVGLLLVLSSSGLIVHLAVWSSAAWKKKASAKALKEKRVAELTTATPEEKSVLASYTTENTRSLHLPSEHGVIAILCEKHILSPTSIPGTTMVSLEFGQRPFQINAWAWEYLQQHPELLDGVESVREVDRGWSRVPEGVLARGADRW